MIICLHIKTIKTSIQVVNFRKGIVKTHIIVTHLDTVAWALMVIM